MFTMKTSAKKSALEEAIDALHSEMLAIDPSTPQFTTMADNLSKLYKLREYENKRKPLSPDAVLAVAGNLIGIVLIIKHEEVNIIATKAIGFVGRFK